MNPRTLLFCAALAAVPLAAAQGPQPKAQDPLDPRAAVPALVHRSALADYRRLDGGAPLSWREANDTVARIGGWRAYLRDAQAGSPAAPTPDLAASAPAAAASAPGRHH